MNKKVLVLSLLFSLVSCGPISTTSFTTSSNVVSSLETTSEVLPKYTSEEIINLYKSYDSSYTGNNLPTPEDLNDDFIKAVDVSFASKIVEGGGSYIDFDGYEKSIYKILKNSGVNAVRIRLFHNWASLYGQANNGDLDLNRVFNMAKEAYQEGLKLILDLHYSDTWADPDSQQCPYAWKDLSYDQVKVALNTYTKETVSYFITNGVPVDYIQIGNEINSGMCFPFGQIDWTNDTTTNEGFDRFVGLLKEGSSAVREVSPDTKIIIHSANALRLYEGSPVNAKWFYQKLADRNLDYDIIGSSLYSFYGDGPVSSLTNVINTITTEFNKPFMVMENSYGFTNKYADDGTSNLLYTTNKDVNYDLSIKGQAEEVHDILEQLNNAKNAIGYAYWGGEWIYSSSIAYNNWENQALFTFEGVALPVLNQFNN